MTIIFLDLDDTLILRRKDVAGKRMAGNLILQMVAILEKHQLPALILSELRQITRTSIFWNATMDFLDHSNLTSSEVAIIRNELDDVLIRHEHDHQDSYLPDETVPFLKALIHAGYRLVMLTNTSRSELDAVFRKYGLAPFFIDSITRDDVHKIKPHIEGLLHILERYKENDFVIVDDLDYGVMVTRDAAKRGYQGFSILVDRDKYSKEQLKQMSPDAIVSSLEEILDILNIVT